MGTRLEMQSPLQQLVPVFDFLVPEAESDTCAGGRGRQNVGLCWLLS